uniref:Uncharacterized protein n=1 Tax=Escherichia coli TaxID=562 RepID=A0A6G9I2K4_ECOLX|nr:hypothetical protein [Escherichia coli]
MNKPVVLSDLDDTLFQTRRKMVDELASSHSVPVPLIAP